MKHPILALAAAATFSVLAALPVSAAERPKPTPATMAPFQVVQPFPNVWYGRFGQTNCAWIDAGDGVFLVDTGGSAADAKNLKAEIARTTKNKPVKWIAMTHLHADSNGGFPSFLPTSATVFVNARATGLVAGGAGTAKAPEIVGVADRIALVVGKQAFEIGVPAGNAHSGFDLYVLDAGTRTVFAGDLVTTDRCPMLSDPDSDLKGWIAALDKLAGLKPAALVPTRENATPNAAAEIDRTRQYLSSMLAFLTEKKKQNAPEARVSGELSVEKIGDYCPRELNALNALSVYRRLQPDGTTIPGSLAAAQPKK
jgi:glyoxylase-like metal-dependent hydrolase (beta-lactamase superfamily II)